VKSGENGVVAGSKRRGALHLLTRCVAEENTSNAGKAAAAAAPPRGRREFVLNSSSVLVLGGLFGMESVGAAPRPAGLGLKKYGDIVTLGVCPTTPNCVSTAEEMNDDSHYIPPWTYNPEDGRGIRKPATQAQAMEELVEVVTNTDCDGFKVNIVKRLSDYLYVEYTSPKLGYIDDVELFFPPGELSRVEYRSASRAGKDDGGINRKRIKALRVALQKKGWKSIGF